MDLLSGSSLALGFSSRRPVLPHPLADCFPLCGAHGFSTPASSTRSLACNRRFSSAEFGKSSVDVRELRPQFHSPGLGAASCVFSNVQLRHCRSFGLVSGIVDFDMTQPATTGLFETMDERPGSLDSDQVSGPVRERLIGGTALRNAAFNGVMAGVWGTVAIWSGVRFRENKQPEPS